MRTRDSAALPADLATAVVDALPFHIAVLDHRGRIVAVNAAWRRFAIDNAPSGSQQARAVGVGASYLDACRAGEAAAAPGAREAREGIEGILAGKADAVVVDYPCHSPDLLRWFQMTASPLASAPGVVVAHRTIPSARAALSLLSSREAEIFQGIVTGRSLVDIAAALGLSPKTVSVHKTRLMRKLKLAGNAALFEFAVRQGIAGR